MLRLSGCWFYESVVHRRNSEIYSLVTEFTGLKVELTRICKNPIERRRFSFPPLWRSCLATSLANWEGDEPNLNASFDRYLITIIMLRLPYTYYKAGAQCVGYNLGKSGTMQRGNDYRQLHVLRHRTLYIWDVPSPARFTNRTPAQIPRAADG